MQIHRRKQKKLREKEKMYKLVISNNISMLVNKYNWTLKTTKVQISWKECSRKEEIGSMSRK